MNPFSGVDCWIARLTVQKNKSDIFAYIVLLLYVQMCVSRCSLHIGVLSVPSRLVQPGSWFLVLPAVSQQHLLHKGGVFMYLMPWKPLLTYAHKWQQDATVYHKSSDLLSQ